MSTIDRLKRKIKVDKKSGCWEWNGALDRGGYGSFSIARKWWSVHRASWFLHNGQIPDGMHVLHRCDNRKCANPEHLFLGTHKDNMSDRNSKGRQRSGGHKNVGDNNGMACLSNDDVIGIKRMLGGGTVKQKDIARLFGVSPQIINDIAHGRRWQKLMIGENVMADIADIANDLNEQMLEMSLTKALETKHHLPITGFCHNCQSPVAALYCDDDCREDYLKRERAIRSS